MPTATVNNPDANFSGRRAAIRFGANAGQMGRPSKTPHTFTFGGRTTTTFPMVPETLSVRYKKKRPLRGRTPARGRAALTIQLDSEKPIPRF